MAYDIAMAHHDNMALLLRVRSAYVVASSSRVVVIVVAS
jgi:hypothetical protein